MEVEAAMERQVWYQLMDASTRDPYLGIQLCRLRFMPDCLIADLVASIPTRHKNILPADLEPGLLKIYATRAAYDQNAQPLNPGWSIGQFGETCERAFIVEVPLPLDGPPFKKQRLHPFLNSWEHLGVDIRECHLDELVQHAHLDNPVVPTPTLHSFWKGYGDFPPSYFVRKEEAVFWQVVKPLLSNMMKNRIVLVGSSGVGKTCFLVRLAFYLACVKKQRVVIIRNLKLGGVANAVVYLDGRGHVARRTNVGPSDLEDIRWMLRGAYFFVDGYDQDDLRFQPGLLPFNIMATSYQFDVKGDDTAELVVLPAWQLDDLLKYAKHTNWVVDAGLRQTKPECESTLAQLAMEQYFFSGGSLRRFCWTRRDLKIKLRRACKRIDHVKGFNFVNAFGVVRSSDQVDRVSRHYVTDPSNADHYVDSTFWTVAVDSGYALRLLGRYATMKVHGQLYTYAKSIGGGFEGIAYEQLFHRAVGNAAVKASRVQLMALPPSEYTRLEIGASTAVCSGEDETECHTILQRLDAKTYWHPEVLSSPFVDAVAPCVAFRGDGTKGERVLALLHVTIQKEKEFNLEHWQKLNDVLDTNAALASLKRVFLVVIPVKAFDLKNKPADVPFVATCFDPSPFAPQPATVEAIQGGFES